MMQKRQVTRSIIPGAALQAKISRRASARSWRREGRSLKGGEGGLNDSHFDAVLEHLAATLKELKVSEELIQKSARIAESVRDEVLGRP